MSNTWYLNKFKKSNTMEVFPMINKIMDILAGLKMTIVSGT